MEVAGGTTGDVQNLQDVSSTGQGWLRRGLCLPGKFLKASTTSILSCGCDPVFYYRSGPRERCTRAKSWRRSG